ncbi:hypothetical protein BGZ80_009368 [Entomortierella chlamydospora]|uniref:DUF3730 domain-containing protein n=1 Tax=Entomortierella chlamydospora TaxID=101097 RepID=A0A9P6MWY8_9FUNG|nr:hypothetical protein BGZ80_009368 [Entomortierella chlamydospora]
MATPRKLNSGISRADSDVRPGPASMANAGTHRSVNVQKISHLNAQVGDTSSNNNSRNLALAQLWSQCASPISYTSSVATVAIIDLVSKHAVDWGDALEGFENALATSQGLALANIVHSLSNLFIAAAEISCASSKTPKLTISRNVFGAKNNRHPFIALISTKTSVEALIFAEMDKIMDQQPDSPQYRISAFEILSPFLDFCLLDRDGRTTITSSTAILWIVKTLNSCLLDSELEPFVVRLFDYLCSISSRFPLDRSQLSTTLQTTISTLVDFYCLSSTQHSLSAEYKQILGSRILLTLLSWMSDMRRFGLTTLPLMYAAQNLFRIRKGYALPCLPFDTLWPLLSFLLLNSPTVDEQRIIVDWMHAYITTAEKLTNAMIANLAFLPVFQVMGESQSEAVTKKCSEILQRLEVIPRATQTLSKPSSDHLATAGVTAMIQAEVLHLHRAWCSSQSEDQETLFTLGDDKALSSLIFTTFMFHPDENKRIDAMTRQAQVEEGRLVTLVLFIYLLRVDPSPRVKLHLLQEAIPSLVTSSDEVVTAKILRTVLTLINGVPNAPSGSKFVNSHMGAVGVRILFLIWKRQPRVWKTLRHVIHGWVESRPRLFKTPVKGEPEYDMEVAVLATIRDICAFDAAGYAEVLIPFLANLLGSVELYASSICTIIETMNLTVEANVVEPRAAWNVLLCHVAEHAVKTGHPGMLQEMCVFYGIVGSRSEDTQVYLDLREAVLVGYIQPLLSSEDPEVLSAALKALSCFTAPEILPILPTESPILYVRERILEADDTMVVDEYSLILDKLVRHELLHMRRGLFKDAAFKKATSDASSGAQELERLQGVLSVVSSNILQKWQSGDVNPGLRIGYALSSQLCSSVVNKADGEENRDSAEAIRAQQDYRNVMTALTDVTLTDHIVERISALEGWTALFDNMWVVSDDAQTLAIAETLIADLYKKIADGYVPAHCANALFAITGIILSLHRHSHPASTVQSSVLAKHLLQSYVRPESLSDVGGSDEVQFAVLVSLSFITPLAAVDEKLVTSVLSVFSDRLQTDSGNSSAFSDLSSWATFATGWAFCNLLAGLVNAPTKTAELNEICLQTLQQLLNVFEVNSASFALTLGILIAFPRLSIAITSSTSTTRKTSSSNEEMEAVRKIKAMARSDLEKFLENQQQTRSAQALARLLGAPWVIAFSDRTEASLDERKQDTGLLDNALLAATGKKELQPQLVHFTVPFCHMIHTNLDVRNPSSSEISLFTGRIHSLVNLIRITPTSAARHTAVVALASLFGVDWSQGPTVTSVGSQGLFSYLTSSVNPVAMATVTNSALTTLMELCGLSISITTASSADSTAAQGGTSPSAHAIVISGLKTPSAKSALMVQDLKAGRLAAMTLGHIACLFVRLGQADSGKVVGTSSEPKDYSRLLVSTSWLRALWDGAWEPLQMGTAQRAQKSYFAALELLLYTVHSLPTPLPAVNWFPLLTQLVSMEPKLIVPAIHMASRHANTSTSLMEFLIMSMSNFQIGSTDTERRGDLSAEELFVGEEGLGRILTLGGLPLIALEGDQALAELDKVRGLDGLAKRVTLPSSRVIDLVEKLVKALFFDTSGTAKPDQSPEIEVLQLVFLDTLSNHIRSHRQGSSTKASGKSKQVPALSNDAKELLSELRGVILRVFYQVNFTKPLTAQRILRRLADLSLMSVSHLDAAQLDVSGPIENQVDASVRVLKEAIGVTSLYRAGYLTSQQEGRLARVAQSALLVVSESSTTTLRSNQVKLAETAISVLLYSMNAGVGGRITTPLTKSQRKKKNTLRMAWLQRILDLLVLLSSQPKAFAEGLRLLLGGSVLLWWDEHDVAVIDLQGNGLMEQDVLSAQPTADDAEANLLAMVEDHDLELESSESGLTELDYNILEDDEFERWHRKFLQSVSFTESVAEGMAKEEELRRTVLGRMSLIMPDIVMSVRGNGSSSSSDNQTASRLMRLALDSHIENTERQFLVTLLRRMEELVPRGQSWVLR